MCLWQVNSKEDANDPYLLGFILLCNSLPLSVMGLVTHFFFLNFGCVEALVQRMGFSSCGWQAYLPRGMSDLSCPTRSQTHAPCTARGILNHQATREVLWLTSNQQRITKVMGCYFYDQVTYDHDFCLSSRITLLLALMKKADILKKPK